MKKILTIITFMAAAALTTSCQKELPDSFANIEVEKGDKGKDPSPTPVDPNPQGSIPTEDDNPWPGY